MEGNWGESRGLEGKINDKLVAIKKGNGKKSGGVNCVGWNVEKGGKVAEI